MALYTHLTKRQYGFPIGASGDWNLIVDNFTNHEDRLLILEGLEDPGDPTPTNLPIGGIILWNGSVATIPEYFSLCDGTNGTPDLRDKFVIGAGNDYAPDDEGGAEEHNHTINNTGSAGSHTHSFSGTTGGPSNVIAGITGNGAASGTHTHSFSGSTGSGGSHSHSVPDASTENHLPPYYALCYIMRTS